HLSYKDMEENANKHFKNELDMDYTVHSPDLFVGDHILDLCSKDEAYRKLSVGFLQKAIDITRDIKPFFKKARIPMVIVSVGGWSEYAVIPHAMKKDLYEMLEKSLQELDLKGVELLPQTMPPFPWYFGGQRYCNLFVDPNEIAAFCSRNKCRVCFDISHSKLACNNYKWSFKNFIDVVGPYIGHMHIADAKGLDGEGLQINEGDIDFSALAEQMDKVAPNSLFIPEIWNGHENGGEGMLIALKRLEGLF
ncbi:MAG: sugar phosphate isomerase/epimerase, partial [Candidatus Heimdallarchaeota archaeon]|nr:sugar phosphate isomerase/epimerase [Candidatus Heimdallarchaeota archaeon]